MRPGRLGFYRQAASGPASSPRTLRMLTKIPTGALGISEDAWFVTDPKFEREVAKKELKPEALIKTPASVRGE